MRRIADQLHEGAKGTACGGKRPPKEPPVVEAIADAAVPEPPEAAPPEPKSLFECIGGKEALKGIFDTFVKNVQGDKKVSKIFSKTLKLDPFKEMLSEYLCEKSGGECKYSGKPFKDAFKGLKVTEEQWNAMLEDLKAAMDEKKVGDAEQGDLVSLMAPLKDEIVEVKPKK